jgi:predicted negative regulator of RcsB-dependent stress response
MQAQDTATGYFFKTWSWVEANLKQVALALVVVIVIAVLTSYYFWRQNQTEIDAGQALTQMLISINPSSDADQVANAYFKVATDYPGTQGGGRALVLGATMLFENGKFPDAQAQYQKYLDTYQDGAFAAPAVLGIAVCLEAEGKTDAAANAYQRVINGYSGSYAVSSAKFALGKIDEKQGKLVEAENYFQQVARDNPNTAMGSEAAFRAYQLSTRSSAAAPSNTVSAPFRLSTKP